MSLPTTNTDVEASTLAILREVCQQGSLLASLDKRLDEIADLDSLKLMEAVALSEERFSVEVDTGGLDKLATVGDIVRLLLRALAHQAAG